MKKCVVWIVSIFGGLILTSVITLIFLLGRFEGRLETMETLMMQKYEMQGVPSSQQFSELYRCVMKLRDIHVKDGDINQ